MGILFKLPRPRVKSRKHFAPKQRVFKNRKKQLNKNKCRNNKYEK